MDEVAMYMEFDGVMGIADCLGVCGEADGGE